MVGPRTRPERLAELLEALRLPGPRPRELSDAVSGELWDQCIRQHVDLLPFRDRLTVERGWHLSQAGLLAARKGDLASARQFFTESNHARRGLPVGQTPWAFCQSGHSAAEAYLLYRQGRYSEARAALGLSNNADLILLGHGIAVAHMHRTQLVHNLMRVEIRCRALDLADSLAERLLAHLQGESSALPLPGDWGPELVDACPIELVAATIDQVESERGRLAEVLEAS